jgi:hypothetical protein
VVLGLGRMNIWDIEGEGTLQVINLVNPERIPDPPELASESAAAEAAAGGSWLAGEYVVVAADVPAPALNEYETVLAAAASTKLRQPIVPRPRLRAETIESGFTPIHLTSTAVLASNSRGRAKRGGGGGVTVTFGGGGVCGPAPAAIFVLGPSSRVPLARR